MKNRSNLTSSNLSRRGSKLTAAVFGGVLLGSTLTARFAASDKAAKGKHDPELLLQDKHVCRGSQHLQGKGKGKRQFLRRDGQLRHCRKHILPQW